MYINDPFDQIHDMPFQTRQYYDDNSRHQTHFLDLYFLKLRRQTEYIKKVQPRCE